MSVLNFFMIIKFFFKNCITPFFLIFIFVKCSNNDLSQKKTNILFILTDDQRANTINYLGNDDILTPNIDFLAKNGISFLNTTIMGANNGAVCAPSRAMIMTGRSLYEIDPTGTSIDNDFVTLPKFMNNIGYDTFHTGKWHNGIESFKNSFSNGKNIFFGGMSDHYKVPLNKFSELGNYSKDSIYFSERHSANIYSDTAVEYIKNHNGSNPFFMFVSFQTPHDPKQVPDEFLNMYNKKPIDIPTNFKKFHPFDNGELDIRDEWLARFPREKDEVIKHIKAYYGMITHTDHRIGLIINALKKKGVLDNTLIIFTSDNGLAVGQHGLMGKQNLYDHSIKVPLIMTGPEIDKDKKKYSHIYLNDIYPTICKYLGLNIPESVTMSSFMNLLNSDLDQTERKHSVHAYKNFQRAIRSDNFKLIKYNVDGVYKNQLFDITNDPFETNNLIGLGSEMDSIEIKLTSLLQKELIKIGDSVKFNKPSWGVKKQMGWIKKMEIYSPEGLKNLRELAKKEHL